MKPIRLLSAPILASVLPLVALSLLCFVPLANLFLLSFRLVSDDVIVPVLSLANYDEVLASSAYRWLIAKALLYGLGIASITAIIAYPIAFFVAALRPRDKGAMLSILLLPVYTGDLIRVFAWRLVLGAEGIINSALQVAGLIAEPIWSLSFSPQAVWLVESYNTVPFMILALWVAVETLDRDVIDAARDLGASRIQLFLRVTLPLTLPGLAVGCAMVFSLVAGDYLTPQMIGGASGETAVSAINSLFGAAYDWPLGSAIAWTLLTALLCAFLGAWLVVRQAFRLRRRDARPA
jgi:spermidine/putrescine transport system permease protein